MTVAQDLLARGHSDVNTVAIFARNATDARKIAKLAALQASTAAPGAHAVHVVCNETPLLAEVDEVRVLLALLSTVVRPSHGQASLVVSSAIGCRSPSVCRVDVPTASCSDQRRRRTCTACIT